MLVTYSGLVNGGTGEGTAVAGVATAKSRVGYGRIVALGSGVAVLVGETAVAGEGVVAAGVGLTVGGWERPLPTKVGSFLWANARHSLVLAEGMIGRRYTVAAHSK